MLFKLLLFLCFYLPFQVAINPAESIDLASIRVIILLVFFVWLGSGLKNKKILVRDNILTGLLIVFLAVNFLSSFWADNISWSVRKLLFLFSIFPLYFVVSGSITSQAKLEKILKMLVASGAILAAVGVLQFFLQNLVGLNPVYHFWANYVVPPFLGPNETNAVLNYPSWLVNISGHTYMRAISFFPDPHMLSMYLGLLTPLAVGLWLQLRKKYWLLAAAIILLADILTFSRGGYLGLLAGFLFALIFLTQYLGRRIKFALAGLALSLFVLAVLPNPISTRFFSTFNFDEGSNAGRIEMWETAGVMIVQHPLSGVGIGNFAFTLNPTAGYREPIYAHDTYLDVSAEAGVLAGISWLGILSLAAMGNIKRAKKSLLYLCLSISIVIFMFHSIVETGLYSPTVLTLLMVILGLSGAKYDEKNN